MKKGFTIVELITVIVLLSLIALFSYPVVTKTLKNRNEDLYQIQVKNIKNAALSYINKNSLLKDGPVIVTVCQLKQNGFLEEDIKDPRDKSFIPDDSKVTVIPSEDGNEYIFTLGENKSNYCGVGSTTIFEYVEAGSTYVETVENISNYKIYLNNSSDEYLGNDYIRTDKTATYFIEYRSRTKTIQKYVYVIDTTAPKLTYKEKVNGSKEIGNNLITIEASSSLFSPYEVVVTDNSSDDIQVKVTSNVNTKIPGSYYITYSASDSSGNSVSKTQTINIEDTVGPNLIVNGVDGEASHGSIIISADADDNGSGLHPNGAYSFDGGETWQVSNVLTVDENKKVTIVVRDLVGNKTTKTVNIKRIIKDANDISFSVLSGVMKNDGWFVTDVSLKIKPLLAKEYFASFSYCKTDGNSCNPNTSVNNYDGITVNINENTDNTVYCALVNRKDGTISDTVCSSNFKVDKINPNVSISAQKESGTSITSGEWSNENVVLTGSVNPSTSPSGYTYAWYNGSTKVSSTQNYTATVSGTYTFVVTTGSGVSSQATFIVNIDKEAPTCSLRVSGTLGTNGWYKSSVVTYATFDDDGGSGVSSYGMNGSGVASYKGNYFFATDGSASNATVYCYVKDGAGNVGQNSVTFNIDSTKPTVSIWATKESGTILASGDWSNENVRLLGQPDPARTASGYTYAWYNGSTKVSSTKEYIATESGTYKFVVTTGAGVSSGATFIVNIDKEAPTCNLTPSGTLGDNGWYKSNVTVNGTFNDTGGSEVSGKKISLSTTASYDVNDRLTIYDSASNLTVYCYVKDGAGNTGQNSVVISIDPVTPTATITGKKLSGASIESGEWSNESIFLTGNVNPSRATSGYTYAWYNGSTKVSSTKYYTATESGTYRFVVTTGAGASSEASFVVNIDKVKPTCSLSPSGTAGTNGWYKSNVTVNGTFNDTGGSEVSGKDVSGSNSASYNGNTSYTVTSNTSGTTVYCYVKDGAGNIGSNSITIKKDDGKDAVCYTEGESSQWSRNKPIITFNAQSASGICGYNVELGSGPIKTMNHGIICTLPSGASATCSSRTINVYYDSEPPTCTYSGDFTSTSDGAVTLTIGCDDGDGSGCSSSNTTKTITSTGSGTFSTTIYDNAGNSTVCSKRYNITVDKIAPTCSINVTGSDTSGLSATITVTDTGGSGLAYPTVPQFYVSNLLSTKYYTMEDNAGNTSTCTVNVKQVRQERSAVCATHTSCESSSCPAKRCVCSRTKKTTYSCPGGWTLSGKTCYLYQNGEIMSAQSATENISYVNNYCTDGEKCGYTSCQATNCPCDTWEEFSQWSENSSCTAGKTSEMWTECRRIYVLG